MDFEKSSCIEYTVAVGGMQYACFSEFQLKFRCEIVCFFAMSNVMNDAKFIIEMMSQKRNQRYAVA